MIYTTIKLDPVFKQMTIDDLWFNTGYQREMLRGNKSCTRTTCSGDTPIRNLLNFKLSSCTDPLSEFVGKYEDLISSEKTSLYKTFYIEKHGKGLKSVFKAVFDTQKKFIECDSSEVCRFIASKLRPVFENHECSDDRAIYSKAESEIVTYLRDRGFDTSLINMKKIISSGYRRIDAPKPELKKALSELKKIFEDDFGALYHTSAFAYVKGRSTLDSVKRHQQAESKWFAKFDLSDFFGSTTPGFVNGMLSQIFPFSEVISNTYGKRLLDKALSLAFLNNGLPQGTPLSPTLTNIIMIPVDYTLSNMLTKDGMVYTRYADDFLVSSKYDFDYKKVESEIKGVLSDFNAPFTVKNEKTRYGSSSGANWNLGVMLNKDNNITVGYKKKKEFQAMLSSYVMDRKKGCHWDRSEIYSMQGYYSYYKMIEGDTIDRIVEHLNQKFNTDILSSIKEDLNS